MLPGNHRKRHRVGYKYMCISTSAETQNICTYIDDLTTSIRALPKEQQLSNLLKILFKCPNLKAELHKLCVLNVKALLLQIGGPQERHCTPTLSHAR